MIDRSPLRLRCSDGFAIHRRVPMHSWCVTRNDLVELRSGIKDALKRGHLLPTALDPFEPSDYTYGPCIHTVVDQFIKPITYMAGSPSWALMKHPNGLKCDLFVTHGWTEGVFEFIDKVLYSWPHNARHAYCCMLSNPQNLDIGSMIASPAESPFAQALDSASHVLVVPNRKESIYCRIWCTYEAYLAYKWKKIIFVASQAPSDFWSQLVLAGLIALAALLTEHHLHSILAAFQPKGNARELHVLVFVCQVLTMLVPLMPASLSLRLCNYAGIIAGSLAFRFHAIVNFRDAIAIKVFSAILFFITSEADRMILRRAVCETNLLKQGFSGKVRDARSSVEEDKVMILRELCLHGQEAAVDHTIRVLLDAGMSTDNLRHAASHGISIDSAGVFRMSFVILWAGSTLGDAMNSFSSSYFLELHGQVASLFMGGTSISTLVIWMCLFINSDRDSRAFSAKVIFKLMVFVVYPLSFACFTMRYHGIDRNAANILHQIRDFTMVGSGLLALLISAKGLGGLVSLPFVGPCAARFILAGSFKETCTICSCRARGFAHDRPETLGGVVELGRLAVPAHQN